MPVGQIALGEKVRAIREGKGWTQEDLAAKAGVHPKTVRTIEKSKPSMLRLIGYVAKALDLECGDILKPKEPEPLQQKPEARTKRVPVILRWEAQIEDITIAGKFIEDFKQFLSAKYPVLLCDIDAGSLIATLEMEFQDVVSMLFSFCRGKFERFMLREIIFPDLAISDLRPALLAIHIRIICGAIRKGLTGVPLATFLREFSIQLIAQLRLKPKPTVFISFQELGRLRSKRRSVAYIYNWLRHSETRKLLTHFKLDELRKTLRGVNVAVEVLADGSVKVVRTQRSSSPLAAN